MIKRTTVNKFFLYRKMNKVFSKWKFFYNRYANKVAFFKDGFYLEKADHITPSTINRTKDLTKMVFWLLDLTEVGYSSKLRQNKRNLNVEWELVKGEGKFVELYGNVDHINKQVLNQAAVKHKLKSSLIDFFWQKHDIILDNTEIKLSFDSLASSKKQFLKAYVACNEKMRVNPSQHKKNVKSLGLDHHLHSLFRKDMKLLKDKSSLSEFDLPIDYKRLSLLRDPSNITPYDEVDLYINAFGYTRNTGTPDVNIFKKLVKGGHQSGRFKLLPSYVVNFDDPALIMPGTGFQNYLKVLDKRELALAKLFIKNSKMFMPGDGNQNVGYVSDVTMRNALLNNYYEDGMVAVRNYDTNFRMENILENINIDYAMYSFSRAFCKKEFNKEGFDTLTNIEKHSINLFSVFWELRDKLLFADLTTTTNLFSPHLHQLKLKNTEKYSGLTYDDYVNINKNAQKLLKLGQKKELFFGEHYTTLYTMQDLFLKKWNRKLKQLFLLRVDLRSNWGYYLDKQPQQDLEDGLSKRSAPYTMEHAYKLYLETVRHPTIIQAGKRPYKWTSIPLLQHSPFLYWMNNVRSSWFYIYDHILGLFHSVGGKNQLSFGQSVDKQLRLMDWVSKSVILRYLDKNDLYYNSILKFLLSNFFFSKIFGDERKHYFKFTMYLDNMLSLNEAGESFNNKNDESFSAELIKNLDKSLPFHFYKDIPQIDVFSLFKYNGYFNYGSSRLFEVDWQTDYRTANLTRAPLLSKIGLGPGHFSFFSFFSRDFFEQAVGYKSWMKFRTFETPYMEEKSWREFTFLHHPLIDLTADITLSKYKSDLLYLLELGFHDIVFEKEIFYKTHYLSQKPKLRDIFEFQEFTAPFFFFDSERAVFGNVPQGLPFEYVSSFGIPLLDKRWMVNDVLHSNVIRDLDRGQWYVRSDEPGNFKHTWRKDRLVHKFIHENNYHGIFLNRSMHVFLLTSVKGSKLYNPEFEEKRRYKDARKPAVIGVLYTSMQIIHKKGDTESPLFLQYRRLHNSYFKSFFFLLLKQAFKVSPEKLSSYALKIEIFLKSFQMNIFMNNQLHFLILFSKIYKIISRVLYYKQIDFALYFKKESTQKLLNSLYELILYMRMLTFIFKNKG